MLNSVLVLCLGFFMGLFLGIVIGYKKKNHTFPDLFLYERKYTEENGTEVTIEVKGLLLGIIILVLGIWYLTGLL